jgi:death-on-curing protein
MRSWGDSLPSESVQFLSLDEALAIHQRVLDVFGGAGGVRDLGLLESALYRPQSGYYEDLISMAAALFESLLMNHPFIDGNKRVAFFATDVFLRLNGWRFDVDADEAHTLLIGLLENGRADLENLSTWIRDSLVKHG